MSGLSTVVLALPVVLLAERAWALRWMSDDGFINLRVVQELLAGHGPVFNPGERVEAATSPLWIGVLAVGHVLVPVRLEWLAVVLGIALTLVGAAAAVVASTWIARAAHPQRFLLPLGAVVLAVVPPVAMGPPNPQGPEAEEVPQQVADVKVAPSSGLPAASLMGSAYCPWSQTVNATAFVDR